MAESAGHNITLNLIGDNVIKIDAGNTSAFYSNGRINTLKLKCEGDEATLKIWIKKPEDPYAGFYNFENILIEDFLETNYPPNMAAEGYQVIRTSRFDDGDGYYWIYFVKKIA